MDNIIIKPSKELAYWTGVVQTDGSLKSYKNKKTSTESVLISLHTSPRSLDMVKKFQLLSQNLIERHSNIWQYPEHNSIDFHIGVKSLLESFRLLDIKFGDPPNPPEWCLTEPQNFGAYLAGVIDGDGSVKITGKKYPQCYIKITSGTEQVKLAEAIRKILGCWVGTYPNEKTTVLKNGKVITGKYWELFFLASSKTREFLEKFTIPFLSLSYKKSKMQEFLVKRYKK